MYIVLLILDSSCSSLGFFNITLQKSYLCPLINNDMIYDMKSFLPQN